MRENNDEPGCDAGGCIREEVVVKRGEVGTRRGQSAGEWVGDWYIDLDPLYQAEWNMDR